MQVEFTLTHSQKMLLLEMHLKSYGGTPLKEIFLRYVKATLQMEGMSFIDKNQAGSPHRERAERLNREWFDDQFCEL
jgi:hypothetical protein